jgi:hypothetical protein
MIGPPARAVTEEACEILQDMDRLSASLQHRSVVDDAFFEIENIRCTHLANLDTCKSAGDSVKVLPNAQCQWTACRNSSVIPTCAPVTTTTTNSVTKFQFPINQETSTPCPSPSIVAPYASSTTYTDRLNQNQVLAQRREPNLNLRTRDAYAPPRTPNSHPWEQNFCTREQIFQRNLNSYTRDPHSYMREGPSFPISNPNSLNPKRGYAAALVSSREKAHPTQSETSCSTICTTNTSPVSSSRTHRPLHCGGPSTSRTASNAGRSAQASQSSPNSQALGFRNKNRNNSKLSPINSSLHGSTGDTDSESYKRSRRGRHQLSPDTRYTPWEGKRTRSDRDDQEDWVLMTRCFHATHRGSSRRRQRAVSRTSGHVRLQRQDARHNQPQHIHLSDPWMSRKLECRKHNPLEKNVNDDGVTLNSSERGDVQPTLTSTPPRFMGPVPDTDGSSNSLDTDGSSKSLDTDGSSKSKNGVRAKLFTQLQESRVSSVGKDLLFLVCLP